MKSITVKVHRTRAFQNFLSRITIIMKTIHITTAIRTTTTIMGIHIPKGIRIITTILHHRIALTIETIGVDNASIRKTEIGDRSKGKHHRGEMRKGEVMVMANDKREGLEVDPDQIMAEVLVKLNYLAAT